MGRGRALLKCNITIAGQYREYGYSKLNGWISNLGGNTSTSVTTSTTHLVATEKAWRRKDAAVKNALRLNKEGEADIKIVSFDWLEDSVNNKTKKREGPYLWEIFDATLTKRDAAKACEQKTKRRKDHVGMMAEVFEESTKDYVDPKEAREFERHIEKEKRVQAAMKDEKKRLEKEQKRLKHAERFKRGVKKARNEIFSGELSTREFQPISLTSIVLQRTTTSTRMKQCSATKSYAPKSTPVTIAMHAVFLQ
jgi:hypothetical protein